MPQSTYNDRDNGITFACDCEIIPLPLEVSIGSGMCKSYAFPDYGLVYSYECYSGSSLCRSFCPVNEMGFGRLMAVAAAIRWDSYNLLDECYRQ
jgi:hypothetical protein